MYYLDKTLNKSAIWIIVKFADFQIYSENVVTYVVTRLDKLWFGLLYLQNQSGLLWITVNATIQKFYSEKYDKNTLSEKTDTISYPNQGLEEGVRDTIYPHPYP